MKLIDNKGKIFGKINIIDLGIILVVLALMLGVGYKLFFQNNNGVSEQPKETKEAQITFRVKGCVPEAERALKVGDKLIVNNVISDAEISEIKSSENEITTVNDQGEVIVTKNPLARDIDVTVRAEVEASNAGITLNDEKMKVNADFIVETMDFYSNTKIVKVSCEE